MNQDQESWKLFMFERTKYQYSKEKLDSIYFNKNYFLRIVIDVYSYKFEIYQHSLKCPFLVIIVK